MYRFQNRGEAQADRDLDGLDGDLQACRAQPEQGKAREDVRPGYRSGLVRKHVPFYTFTDDEVVVQRVLHGSMDPTIHLPDDESAI